MEGGQVVADSSVISGGPNMNRSTTASSAEVLSELSLRRMSGASEVAGKRIFRVAMRIRKTDIPRCQLLFEFDDHTSCEFFCSDVIMPTKGVNWDNSVMGPSDGTTVFDSGLNRHLTGRGRAR
jgi:hypothetical protein